ncbi:MAG TPA: thioredoxin domain-containing protein [Bacteroidetes bacterium]|nr:thioredoxin domain-containing protein [Bacteroidota bacterium]
MKKIKQLFLLTGLSAFLSLTFFCCKTTNGDAQTEQHLYTNKLAGESSPYLLQHAHNPVNWHPWNDEALAEAKAKNKMLIISIGYAACHWCHVMEHESFEDTTVARIMNENFVCIKVDREERPDVDDVYMSACHLASQGSCGWPLNAFALPDGKPVWAATYFPKKKWVEVLEYFSNEWKKDPQKMKEYADQLTAGIRQSSDLPVPEGEAEFKKEEMDNIAKTLLQRIDFQKGGRKGAPKFPMPSNYQFLLKYHHFSGDARSLEAVTLTLDEMAKGGIYDHLGGGFSRYSTDANWLVPHFEKMIYDNAQLVSLYSNAYQVTKNPVYKSVVTETLDFIAREMTSPEGAFYSSFDADSDGEEGKFYVWKKAEVDSILGAEVSAVFCKYYEISKRGNWENGNNILHRKIPASKIAAEADMSEAELAKLIADAKEKLFKAREKRVKPGLDDKALTAWNALMLKGYIDAYRAFGNKKYLQAALKNGHLILDKILNDGGRLNRNFKDGRSVINGFLDDYALTIDAFIALYQVTFDEQWLYVSKDLASHVIEHFSDPESGLFFYNSDLDPPLITRKKETSDNVVPGSNSMMASDLHLLGLYFYKTEWIGLSSKMLHTMSSTLTKTQSPDFYSNWCQVYLDFVRPPYEVAIVGEDAGSKRDELLRQYLPNAIFLGGKDEGTLELLTDKLQEGETLIYVCRNKICKLPVSDVNKAINLIK